MTTILLPRLSRLAVDEVISSLRRRIGHSEILKDLDLEREGMSYASTGGRRVEPQRMIKLRRDIATIAEKHGCPAETSAQNRQQFDTACAVYLAEAADLQSGELLRDDVWAFMATVLMLDITLWRFPTLTPDRFHGGDRNMFQRLWYRAVTLDRGASHRNRWELVATLTEDAIAQIVERPSVRNDRRLAVAIAEGWARMAAQTAGTSMERIMRRTVRDLRMRNEIQLLSALSDDDLPVLIDEQFRISLRAETRTGLFPERSDTARTPDQGSNIAY